METVGIRDLKTHLSRHLKRVRAGARLLVTERGRSIATISPVDGSDHVQEAANQATAVATSRVAYAETRAAFARLRREGQLTSSAFMLVKRQFDE